MPCLIIRKNVVPSYPPDSAVLMKSATWLGARSASRSITLVPADVSRTACFGVDCALVTIAHASTITTTRPAILLILSLHSPQQPSRRYEPPFELPRLP